jgi:hypothetical protein
VGKTLRSGSQANIGLGFFSILVQRSTQNKMGGAAVPLVGMSVAFFIMEMSPLTPNVVRDNVARLGYYMLAANAFVFFIASAAYVGIGLRQAERRRRSGQG